MTGAPPLLSGGEERPVRVLLVEDNPGDARLIREYLTEGGPVLEVEVVAALTLGEGIRAAASGEFDVALLDLSLPDCQGLETFISLCEAAPHLPVVVLSGQEDEELAREIVKRGGQDCLPKDILSAPLLRRCVRHAIERKLIHEELRSMQRQLIQAEKMESVGRLAAGVAHEVKNPLARLQMGVEYLAGGVEPDDPNLPAVLRRMEEAVQRADSIIRGLLDFAADRALCLQEADPGALVDQALALVDYELRRRGISVAWESEPGLPKVRADPGKMEQVFINLFLNAIQAMEERPESQRLLTIRVRVAAAEGVPRDPGVRSGSGLRDGDTVVRWEIEDSGPGIPEEKRGNVFDPFFTTKPAGMGTGLGLSIVRKIVDLHQGRISLRNRPEGGARAVLQLKAFGTGRARGEDGLA